MVSSYIQAYRRQPYLTSFATGWGKGILADYLVQSYIDRRGWLDWSHRQNAFFSAWSGAHGCLQHFFFNVTFDRILGRGTVFAIAAPKAALATFVFGPLVSMPFYYACKATINDGILDPQQGLLEYREEFRSALNTSVSLWLPAHICTFYLVRAELRILWTGIVSIGWLTSCIGWLT